MVETPPGCIAVRRERGGRTGRHSRTGSRTSTQILVKYWSNTGQTRTLTHEHSNTGQILAKYWSNAHAHARALTHALRRSAHARTHTHARAYTHTHTPMPARTPTRAHALRARARTPAHARSRLGQIVVKTPSIVVESPPPFDHCLIK